jgi:HEAT repeat protein
MDLKILLDTPPWDWPRDAGNIFEEILTDNRANESERLVAAELAGDFTVINDELADALMTIIRSADEPEQLRARAAISLGPVLEHADTDGFEDPDDVPITQRTFRNLKDSLHKVYLDDSIPKEVRRRILEASVRAPQNWHQNAIRAAYSSGDKDWMLTAVFSMRWVHGFDDHILEALKTADPEIHYEAVNAAGNWELDAAWSHIVALVNDPATPKPLRLAAIGAVAGIHPQEAVEILVDLAASGDEEIAEAADEAIAMAEGASAEADYEEDASEWIN